MTTLLRTALLYGALLAAAIFGWRKFDSLMDAAGHARARIPGLLANIDASRTAAASIQAEREDIPRVRQSLRKFDLADIAPPDDPFSWARSQARICASKSGLTVLTMAESTDRPPPFLRGQDGPWLVPYRFSMELSGTETDALRFMRCLEDSGDLIQFHHFSILDNRAGKPCLIFVTIEWPMWADSQKVAEIREWRDPDR